MKKHQILYIIMVISLIGGILSKEILNIAFTGWIIYAIIEATTGKK